MKQRILFYSLLIVFIICAALTLSVLVARSDQVTLAWNPNTPAPEGYRLFQRTQDQSYDYTKPVWTGSVTSCTVTNLTPGATYYYVVTAFSGTTQSGPSNEVQYTVPSPDQPTDGDGINPDPPSDLGTGCTQLDQINRKLDTVLEILAGGPPQTQAPAAPYCGNPVSKIFHKSDHWCGKDAAQFNTREEATAAGYRPCGICKP